MKNISVFSCILFLAFFSASKVFAQDSTSIKITLPNSEKWSTDSVKIYNFLHDKWTFLDKIDTAVNSCFIKFPCERAIEQTIYIKEAKSFDFLVLPNDNVEIIIDKENKHTFLKGKAHRENEILYDKLEDYSDFNAVFWIYPLISNKGVDLDTIFYTIDSMRSEILTDYEIITKDFVVDSTFDIYFHNELDTYQYNGYDMIIEDKDDKKNKIPLRYYKYKSKFKNKIDSDYPYSKNYINLLYEQILEENCVEANPKEVTNKYYACAYQQIKKIKNEEIRNYLTLQVLSYMIYKTLWWNEEEERVFNEVMGEAKKAFPNNERIKILEERASSDKSYSRGAPAPDFTLKDLIGKEVSLSDFKGKYVFITFWDSSSEIFEYNTFYGNQLLKKFTEKKVVFIFVAIHQTEQEWKDVLYNEKSIGVHLFANEEQLEDLKNKYVISEKMFKVSNATFIDKYGRRIFNSIYLPHNMWEVSNVISKGE